MAQPYNERRTPYICRNRARIVTYVDPAIFEKIEANRGIKSTSAYVERILENHMEKI